jgi:hypothetical protein
MKRTLIALAIVGLSTGSALAAPGEPRVVQGALEWPATLSTEPFIVVRGEDGRLYYADVSAAQRRTPGPLTAGARVAIVGVEGNRPHEVAALAFGAGDASSLGLVSPGGASSPSASIPSAAPGPTVAAEPMWRLDGAVQAVSGPTVTVRADDGRARTVDVSQLSEATRRALRPGDRVTLFGVPRNDDRLVANGYIQTEPASPAASPRSPR